VRLPDHRLVFVCGLHRSGTTPLTRCLADHPQVSGFRGTGVPEDEGQHLQDVYAAAAAFGGPGGFAFDPRAWNTNARYIGHSKPSLELFSGCGDFKEPPVANHIKFKLEPLSHYSGCVTMIRASYPKLDIIRKHKENIS
jgi:hypothetical protein